MKRIGNIYKEIVSPENCKKAILAAASKYTLEERQKPHIKKILDDIDTAAVALHLRFTYWHFTSPYWEKEICDGLAHKIRKIKIPKFFPDQCAHHAIIQVLQPYILKSSHYWSCSNIPGRGQKRAARGVDKAINQYHCTHCIELDIKQFYPSINNMLLKKFLRTKIKDKQALILLDILIDTNQNGLPIGNYTSPWLVEWYMQQLDHYIIEKLHVKFLVRYADDMRIFDTNKRRLHNALRKIINYTYTNMKLIIKENYQVFQINNTKHKHKGRKVDFIGYCFGKNVVTIRKRRSLRFIQNCRLVKKFQQKNIKIKSHLANGLMSRSAALKCSDSYGLKVKYFYTLDIKQVKEVIRKESLRLCGENRNLQLSLQS